MLFRSLLIISSCLPFLLQVEVPPPVIGGALKEVVATQLPTALGVEKEPPSGGVVREAKQAIKDAEPVPASTSLVIQDLEASRSPITQDPKFVQTPSSVKIVTIEQSVELVLVKESLGVASSSTRTSKPYLVLY